MHHLLIQSDARSVPLPGASVQSIITSVPYWGLRDYGVAGQIGMEATPAEFVAAILACALEWWRVLRDDGCLWLNVGDSYANWVGPARTKGHFGSHDTCVGTKVPKGLKEKDRVGIPHLLVFALRDAGWYWRDEVVWSKPNPMPESVRDRCTKAHEFLFLLTKRARYFYDAEAIREAASPTSLQRDKYARDHPRGWHTDAVPIKGGRAHDGAFRTTTARNKRSVWTISTQSYAGAHFATFPEKLVQPCILAGTSERGCCPKCGAPWRRVVEKVREPDPTAGASAMRGAGHFREGSGPANRDGRVFERVTASVTTAWLPSCKCHATEPPRPCVVYDPFVGSGTTVAEAVRLGRFGIGTDLKADYLDLAKQRVAEAYRPVTAKRRRKEKVNGHPLLWEFAFKENA